MAKQNEYAKALSKKYRKIIEDKNNFSSIISANFGENEHIMLIDSKNLEDFVKSISFELKSELLLLEKVDLIDYWKFNEYGRYN